MGSTLDTFILLSFASLCCVWWGPSIRDRILTTIHSIRHWNKKKGYLQNKSMSMSLYRDERNTVETQKKVFLVLTRSWEWPQWRRVQKDRWMDRQAGRQTDSQTGRQAVRQTDSQVGRQTDWQVVVTLCVHTWCRTIEIEYCSHRDTIWQCSILYCSERVKKCSISFCSCRGVRSWASPAVHLPPSY